MSRKICDGAFAPWPGFTYLLLLRSALSVSLAPYEGSDGRLLQLCTQEASEHEFYSHLWSLLPKLREELDVEEWMFLPFSSYHATFMGAIDVSNVDLLAEGQRNEWRQRLEDPAQALIDEGSFGLPEVISLQNVRMVFDELTIWGNEEPVLVAKLTPHSDCKVAYDHLVKERDALDKKWEVACSKPAAGTYTCHVSIAYGKNAEAGDAARKQLEGLNSAVHSLRGKALDFDHAVLFGFASMVTFFCRKEADNGPYSSSSLERY